MKISWFKSGKIYVEAVGGVLSLMSGGISVPFAVLALWISGTPGFWLTVVAFIALWAFALNTVKASRNEQRKSETVLLALEQKHAEEKEEISRQNALVVQKLVSEKEKVVQDLASRLNKETEKSILAARLSNIRTCRQEIGQTSGYSYNDEVSKANEEKINKIINEAMDCLYRHLGSAEAEIFAGSRPAPLPEPDSYDMFSTYMRTRQWHMLWLDVKYAELKKILERLD